MPPWIQLAAPIATIVGATALIMRTLPRLEARLGNIELRIATVQFQNRALLKAFPQVISSLMAGHMMSSEQGAKLFATALDTAPIR
jgi:hypothetical protein